MRKARQNPNESTELVFFDPQNRRWRRFRFVAALSALLITLLFCGLAVSVVVTPSLPRLALAPVSQLIQQSHASVATPTSAAPNTNVVANPVDLEARLSVGATAHRLRKTADKQPTYATRLHRATGVGSPVRFVEPSAAPPAAPTSMVPTPTPLPTLAAPGVSPTAKGPSQVIGFFVNWDDNSLTSLKQNISHLDQLVPEWLHLTDGSGAISIDDPVRQQEVLTFVQQTRPTLPIVPLINNFNADTQEWDGNTLGRMLNNPTARATNIQALLNFVQGNKFAGVSIDYENISASDQPALLAYMGELFAKFHPLGLEVSLSVPANDDSYDYKALSQSVDYLILMAYDEHWNGSEPGPVASQPWFADELQRRFAEVDPAKYIIGIGSYGYDWALSTNQASEVSFQQAVQGAEKYGATISLDPAALNPTYTYSDATGEKHQVWYLDALSAFNEVAAAHSYAVHGCALWRMGSEDPSTWNVLDHRSQLDRSAADLIQNLGYGYDVVYQGTGEVLKLTSTPKDGHRIVTYDSASGLVTLEAFTAYPSSYVITRWGGTDPHRIAITFDDGPDATWTPQVLKVLQQYRVPATFFVIGSAANLNPGLLQQIVAQGNEVGNHTFSHPDISAISDAQIKLELNATERLFESILGRRSVLFRPPYSEDVEPATPDQARPLTLTGELGYYTVSMHIDPRDYLAPGVNTIVQRVLDQVDAEQGNVILLHDGGGDRSQTVAALPLIIQQLQARGYQFVTVSNLLGLTRDQVMPPISSSDKTLATISGIGFETTGGFSRFLAIFFVVGIVLSGVRFTAVIVMAALEKRQARRRTYIGDYHPSVSVVMPAYNEGKVIERTVRSLAAQSYPIDEIIIVDDGSTDDTATRLRALIRQYPQVRVFRKVNGGKAAALNHGIERCTSDLFLAIDADTVLDAAAAGKLVRHFGDPAVAAVAGNAKVGNRINLLTNWQALEYITGQNLDRRAFAFSNAITVVPGAIGMWRREAVRRLGGFGSDTLAEDAELTLRLLRAGLKVGYDEEAIAHTEAPDAVRGFLQQRFRWMYGTLQAAWKHRDTLFRPAYGTLGLLALPNILVFQVFFPFVSPLLDLVAILSIGNVLLRISQHPLDPTPTNLVTLIFFYVVFLALDFMTAGFAFLLEKKEDWSLITWLLLQRFSYRQLMYYIAVKTVMTAVRGRLVGWGNLERKATIRADL
jgi:cellulose synthase/poly-beta-1,6-N-acetylglucosamine synthase-like glycosyltransferase/spore germination protein YaaH